MTVEVAESFDWLTPAPKGAAPRTPVRFGMMKMRSAPARPYVLLTEEVVARLGGRAMRYRVGFGRGYSAGHLRVIQDDMGPFEATRMPGRGDSATFRILLPHVEALPDAKIGAEPVAHSFPGKPPQLDIELPGWSLKRPQPKALPNPKG